MIDFLLKSTLSLGLLYAVYLFVLQREKVHRFNRFYLLLSLVFSIILPFITIEVYTETVAILTEKVIVPTQTTATAVVEKTAYTSVLVWLIYSSITSALLIRFGFNLIKIRRKIKSNQTEHFQNSRLVLLDEEVVPHTFLKYIFVSKQDYENRKIEDELYTHELTHVQQKHSFDIIFIELLKTIFWFNPVFILYKKAIQLNHEFLADEKVVKSYNNVPFYQNLLLEKTYGNNTFYLASNLNFLVTKKRLIMMTKTTSRFKALLVQFSILPVAVALILSCSTKTVALVNSEVNATTSKIEVVDASNTEMDSLQQNNPKVYANQKASDYTKTKMTYLDENGRIAANTSFEKKVAFQPPILLPKIPLDVLKISRIETKIVSATDADVIALRAAHPEEFSSAPTAEYKSNKIRITLNDSSVVEQISYQKLTKEL